MSTGVHFSVVFRAMIKVVSFVNGQGIHIGA